MTAKPMVLGTDERGIPILDPDVVPRLIRGEDDWRGRLDAVREAYPYFRLGDDPVVWLTRWQAQRDVLADGETFYDPNWVEMYGSHDALLEGSGFRPGEGFDAAAGLKRALRMRQSIMAHMSPRYIKGWEPRMRAIAVGLIERFRDTGECDFVNEFSKFYFPYLSAEWMGMPAADMDMLVDWQHDIFQLRPQDDSRMLHMGGESMVKVLSYIDELMPAKRAQPDDSFTSFVVNEANIDGRPLDDDEARGILTIVVLGSAHTVTSHLGQIFRHLALNPGDRKTIVEQPETIDAFGEEMLRLYMNHGNNRVVTRDVQIEGLQLRRGDEVFVAYTMANRDPRVPGFDAVDLDRRPNPHLAFAFGPHRCIGIHWARIARNIAIEEWHKAIPDYRLDDGVELTEQFYANVGWHNLPLVWK